MDCHNKAVCHLVVPCLIIYKMLNYSFILSSYVTENVLLILCYLCSALSSYLDIRAYLSRKVTGNHSLIHINSIMCKKINALFHGFLFNTLWTGDADLRLCITTVEDGWSTSAFLKRAWFPRTIHFNYAIHAAFLRMVLLTVVYRNVTLLRSNDL
jgi:hypothetical protein